MAVSLIEFINHWVKSVAMIFVLVSIIEIVIPNNNLKRYVNMFIGFLIIIVIITPFVRLIDSSYDIEREIFKNTIDRIEIQKVSNDEILLTQEKQIKELYISKIKNDVLETIREVTDYHISNVNISIFEDKNSFGNVKDIEIVLKDKKGEIVDEDNSIKVINIGEISIDNTEEENTMKKKEEEKERIIEHLNNKYNVSKDNIKVFINTMEEGEYSGESNK